MTIDNIPPTLPTNEVCPVHTSYCQSDADHQGVNITQDLFYFRYQNGCLIVKMTAKKSLLLYLIFIHIEFIRTLYSDHKIFKNKSDIENNNLIKKKDGETIISHDHMTTTENGFCVKKNGDIR